MADDKKIEALRVFVLACGQANTNWIEYYADKTSKVPTATAIFDLGKSGKSNDGDDQAVKWILARIAGFYDLAKADRVITHTIEFVAFSHADEDHWGRCEDLYTLPRPAKLKIEVNSVYRGGMAWKSGAKAAVRKLADAMKPSDAKILKVIEKYRSDLKSDGTPLHPFSEKCLCRVVIANADPVKLATKPLYPSKANASSMVLVFEMNGKSIMLTGDATWVTMHGINALYGAGVGPADCYAMTLPHHGAINTSRNPTNKKETDDTWIFKKFAKNVAPKRIVASAGYNNTHKHPQIKAMELFETGLTTKSVDHNNIVYNGGDPVSQQRDVHSWTTMGDNSKPVTADSTKSDAGITYLIPDAEVAAIVDDDDDLVLGRQRLLGAKRKRGGASWGGTSKKKKKKRTAEPVVRTPLPDNFRHNNIEYLLTSAGRASVRIFPAGVTDDAQAIPVEQE
ncbi:hypothetical protein ABS767_12845 [Sphingomonas sp. ST-64]|uniref:Uncharacterized protein n=1 Tax=Sphingomonas plantiphila TaxID=3163295 RepID=A0ABW8YPK5_9SPHN